MALNTFKYINVYYNKGDRKPYDVNGKPIAYLGTDYVGANEATIIRFNIGDDTGVIDAVADVKRPDGEKAFLVMSKVNVGGDVFYELPLTDWHTAKVGKLVIAFKAFNGTITINDGVIDATGLRVIVSDIFNVEIGYAPNSVQEAPAFDPNDVATFVAALSTKLDKANGINVVQALPTPNDGSLNGRWYLVKTGTEEQLGRLYVFDGDTPIAVELQAEGIKLTPVGNGDVTADTGRMDWEQSNGTVSLGLYNDVFAQLGEDVFYYVKASGAITKGDVIQYAGYQGDHALAKRAVQSEVNANPKLIMGIAKQDIANGDYGYVAHFGKIESIDTKGVAVNSFVWFDSAGSTAGAWTITPPTAPNAKVLLAVILKAETAPSANNGVMLVRPTIEPKLDELQNILITTATNGDVLRYDGTKWVNSNALSVLDTALDDYKDDLDDGTITVDKARKDANGDTIDTTYLKSATASSTYIPLSQKGAVNGVVPLNSNGKISSIYLSGEQDDYVEYANLASFPLIGEADIIYCAIDTGLIYRWTGSTYSVISPSLALGTTASTAFPGDRGLATETQSNNIVSGTQTLTNTRITNSVNSEIPLVINGVSGSNVLQEWRLATNLQAYITGGRLRTVEGVANITSSNNAYVNVASTGTIINRNIADANPSLIVNQANASSTGDILRLQFAGANKLEITKDGFINQNGTRLFTQQGDGSNTFFGGASGGLSTTGTDNTSLGRASLNVLTTGIGNTAIGRSSLISLTTGSNNTTLGTRSGQTITTGSTNTFVGYEAGLNASQLATATNSTGIGNQAYTDKSNQMVFGNASVTEFVFNRNANAVALFGGNVGIGTTSPTHLIHIAGSNGILATFAGASSSVQIGADGNGGVIRPQSVDRLNFTQANGTNVMTINGAKVGIGTASPATTLVVATSSNDAGIQIRRNSATQNDYARLGFRINTNDLNGDFAQIRATRTDRAVFADTDLTLHTFSNNVLGERLRIRDDGLVGINETTPSAQLQVKSGATNRVPLIVDTLASHAESLQVWRVNGGSNLAVVTATGRFRSVDGISNLTDSSNSYVNVATTGTNISRNIADSNPALIVNLANAGATGNIQVWQKAGVAKATITNGGGATFSSFVDLSERLTINVTNSIQNEAFLVSNSVEDLMYVDRIDGDLYNKNGTYGTISDLRLKENVENARDYTEDIMKLRVVKYSFKEDHETKPTHLGFIAQEVEAVFPSMVETHKAKQLEDMKTIKLSVLIPMLVKTIQEQEKRIKDLEAKL